MTETVLAPSDGLKRKTVVAVLWSVLRTGWTTLATFVLFVVLARLLGPADFGVFALASLVLEAARILANAGLADAVIRERELDETLADTAFWAVLGLSALAGAAAFAAAPLYARMLGQEEVAAVIRWLAVLLPVSALGAIHGARLAREFRQKSLALQGMVTSLASGVAAVAAAWAGWGIWALVVQSAVASTLGVGLAWWSFRWRPGLGFRWSRLRGLLGFSASMVTTQLLWMLLVRVQDLFLARWHGTEAVGTYRIAWRLIELIGQSVLAPAGSVALVALSRLQGDPVRFARGYNRILGAAGLAVFPMMFGFGALAPEVFPLLFGETWAGAAPVAMVLVLMAVPFVTNFFAGPALAAVNRAQSVLAVAALQFAATLVLTAALVPFGLMAVAAAYVLRAYLTLPVQQVALRRHAGVEPRDTAAALAPPLLASLGMAAGVWMAKDPLALWLGAGWPMVAGAVVLGVLLHAGLMLLLGRPMLRELADLARSMKSEPRDADAGR
ncbi:lipopolysaccharide biosynthesis protein [Rhodobacter sp. CZR27]|uniref:lipopolysaccharide biosynthesis protein n=1 Tax=Rhodobacter sp. CZR27 TaxID=2033869 RepID=UPI0018E090C4|nr:lipopolysaccharide biosynthesis protein [Rhodobacter sp. CZR27]